MNFEEQDGYEDEVNLEYQRDLQELKKNRAKELRGIYSNYIDWQTNVPHEFDIWQGDSRIATIDNEFSPNLEIWQKWKINRKREDKLIEEAKQELHIVRKLIEIDAISWGFNQFIIDQKIDSLIKIISKWKEDNPHFMNEYNSFDDIEWSNYNFFQQKAIEEYKKIMVRCLRYSAKNESFLGKDITGEDIQHFLEIRQRNFLNNTETYDYKFNLEDICKLELWVKSNHFLEWDSWARLNTNWERYVRNGYAHMYQEVWWKKGILVGNYWDYKDQTSLNGHYNAEFKRRLLVNKLNYLNYTGGKVFNDDLAVIKDFDEYGFINSDGIIVIDGQFDYARKFHEGLAAVKVDEEEYEQYIPEVDEYITLKRGGQWGFINNQGTFVVQPQYSILSTFQDDIAIYCKGGILKEFYQNYSTFVGGKWGIINVKGEEVLQPTYDNIRFLGEEILSANLGGEIDSHTGDFYDGKWCLLSKDGKEISSLKYSWINKFDKGRAIVNAGGIYDRDCKEYCNGKWGYIDKNGFEIEPLSEHLSKEFFIEWWEDVH